MRNIIGVNEDEYYDRDISSVQVRFDISKTNVDFAV